MDLSFLDGQIADATKDLNSLPNKRAEKVLDMLMYPQKDEYKKYRLGDIIYDIPVEVILEIINNPEYQKLEQQRLREKPKVERAMANQNARDLETGHPVDENKYRETIGRNEMRDSKNPRTQEKIISDAFVKYNATISDQHDPKHPEQHKLEGGASDALLAALNATTPKDNNQGKSEDVVKAGFSR